MRDSTRLAGIQQNPLWDFALEFYARPGVSQRLLRLQDDAGMDVCVLLWRLWLNHYGLAPTASAERALAKIVAWQRDYTWPLRDRRRWLKPNAANDPALFQLRDTLKAAELMAEKVALGRLEALARQAGYVQEALPEEAHPPAGTLEQARDLAALWAQSKGALR
ncbi:MAG: TIGR02444 family protein [Halomonas subglaciescola]|nr:TIGR02444 family protein [Halomonas subglaciescola]